MHILKPIAAFLGLTVSLSFANPADSPDAFLRDAVQASAQTTGKGLGDWLYARIDGYDFSLNARRSWESIPTDQAFLASPEFKGMDQENQAPETIRRAVLGFMERSPGYSGGTVAWLKLFFSPGASWEESFPLYKKIAEERPRDFIPKALLLPRPIKTTAGLEEWYSVWNDAYAAAETPRERAFCLLILPGHTTSVADLPGADAHLRKITAKLDDLEKQESVERLPMARDIDSLRFFVYLARRDYASAAAYAKPAGCKSLEPLLFLLAGKNDEAQSSLQKLRRQPFLSEDDQRQLDTVAALINAPSPPPAQSASTPPTEK